MLTQIRTAIVATLNAANVGTFENRERFSKNQRDLVKVYGEAIQGGFIRKIGRKTTVPYEGRKKVSHRFEVLYLMAFTDEDSSQITFEDNLEKLNDKFMENDHLVGLTAVEHLVDEKAGLEELENQPVMFAGVLCHRSRMVLQTEYYT
jgi:hypothetical protein